MHFNFLLYQRSSVCICGFPQEALDCIRDFLKVTLWYEEIGKIMSEFALGPVTLTGEQVRLEPLGMDHVPGLLEAARADFARISLRPLWVSTNE